MVGVSDLSVLKGQCKGLTNRIDIKKTYYPRTKGSKKKMSEIVFETEKEIYISSPNEKPGLPEALRKWLVYPDEWTMERDSIQMQNDLLQAERDELLQYVKNLKKLAVYLIGKTELSESNLSNIDFDKANLSNIDFDKAEKYIPGYLRKEIEIDMHALGSFSSVNWRTLKELQLE
jgi:hypothetical protein